MDFFNNQESSNIFSERTTEQEQVDLRIQKLEDKITEISSLYKVDRYLNSDSQDQLRELIKERIQDIAWEDFIHFSSLDGPAVQTTSSAEKFDTATRQADTSSQKFLTSKAESRFRCHFYFNGTDSLNSTTYIGSFGTATTDLSITSINQEEMEYTALYIQNGEVYLKQKNSEKTVEKKVGIQISDDTTQTLEMRYYPRERVDFFLNNVFIGAMTEAMPSSQDVVTYFPLLVSIKRAASTNRKVTVESYEFLQGRIKQ